MTRDPVNNTLTEWQMALLASIFRFILKEITCEEDKEKLAPGELGINYTEGAFYIRNPHNGKLFSPNSLEYVRMIIKKFNPGTNILNADSVSNIRIYNKLSQLDDLGLSFTPDSVIRQMHSPSIFVGPIEYENYDKLGWPSPYGMLLVYKGDEDHAIIKYFDTDAYIAYDGKYNRHKHLFEGWGLSGASAGDIYTETVGGGDNTSIYIDEEIKDLMVITLRVTETLNPLATISVNNMDPMPIVTKDKEALPHQITENNIIMLIYDEPGSSWVLLESTESAVTSVVTILNERFENLTHDSELKYQQLEDKIEQTEKEYEEKLEDLKQDNKTKLDELEAKLANRPGNIDALVVNYTAGSDGITEIAVIEGFDGAYDKLIVNYGQTLLRYGLDFNVVNNGIQLMNGVTLAKDDVIQFIVLRQAKPE